MSTTTYSVVERMSKKETSGMKDNKHDIPHDV
jgi:hypothetical protein